jgi:hypothetical protein
MGARAGGQFTTGPMHFTTGPMHFTGGNVGVRPIIGVRPVVGVQPIVRPAPVFVSPFPHRRVIVGTTVVVAAPYFWYPPYPYPYPYLYPYVMPVYGSPAYAQTPTYVEQGSEIRYYCPDYQDYYPNVSSCPSPWMQVLPNTGGYSDPQQQQPQDSQQPEQSEQQQ